MQKGLGRLSLKRIVIATVVVVAAVSALVIGGYLLKPKPKYNLLFISVDTLRADPPRLWAGHMGVYGYPKNTLP